MHNLAELMRAEKENAFEDVPALAEFLMDLSTGKLYRFTETQNTNDRSYAPATISDIEREVDRARAERTVRTATGKATAIRAILVASAHARATGLEKSGTPIDSDGFVAGLKKLSQEAKCESYTAKTPLDILRGCDGNLEPFYHATNADFTDYDTIRSRNGLSGVFFSSEPTHTQGYKTLKKSIPTRPIPTDFLDKSRTRVYRYDSTRVLLGTKRPEILAFFRKNLAYSENVLEGFIDEHGHRDYREYKHLHGIPSVSTDREPATRPNHAIHAGDGERMGDAEAVRQDNQERDGRPTSQTATDALPNPSVLSDPIPTTLARIPRTIELDQFSIKPAAGYGKNDSSDGKKIPADKTGKDLPRSGSRDSIVQTDTNATLFAATEKTVGAAGDGVGKGLRHTMVETGSPGESETIRTASRQPNVHLPDSSATVAAITEGTRKTLDARRAVRATAPQQEVSAAKQAYLDQEAAKTQEQKTAEIADLYETMLLALGDEGLNYLHSQGAVTPATRLRAIYRKGVKLRQEGKTLSREESEELRRLESEQGQQLLFKDAIASYLAQNGTPTKKIKDESERISSTLALYSQTGDAFRTKLAEARSGGLHYNERLLIGEVSAPLRLAGLPEGDIFIKVDTALKKPTQKEHPYPHSLLDTLPELLDEPILVHESWTVSDSFVALLDVRDKGKNFIAALHFKKTKNGTEVVDVASFYPRGDGQIEEALRRTEANKKTGGSPIGTKRKPKHF